MPLENQTTATCTQNRKHTFYIFCHYFRLSTMAKGSTNFDTTKEEKKEAQSNIFNLLEKEKENQQLCTAIACNLMCVDPLLNMLWVFGILGMVQWPYFLKF